MTTAEQWAACERARQWFLLAVLVPAGLVALADAAPDAVPYGVALAAVLLLVGALLCLLVWIVLPLAVQQRRIRVVDGHLHAATLLGPRTLDLRRLRRIGARTVTGEASTTTYLSLQAERRLILGDTAWQWSGPPEAVLQALVEHARSSPDVEVSERARVVLGLPDQPGEGRRVVLALRTVAWFVLLTLIATPVFVVPAVLLMEAVLPE